MTRKEAREISETFKFTRRELYDILTKALKQMPDDFWTKRNMSNKSTDNGFYFNLCVKLVDLQENVNEDEVVAHMIAFRVLHIFGEFSEIQPYKKAKRILPKITMSEKPKL
jgi:hypothetical protein